VLQKLECSSKAYHQDILKTKKLKVIKQEVENLNAKLQEKEGRVSELNNMMVGMIVP